MMTSLIGVCEFCSSRPGLLKWAFLILLFYSIQSLATNEINDPLELAQKSYEENNYSACIKLATRAAKFPEYEVEARFSMGLCYERLGEFEASYHQYDLVSKLDPNYPDVFTNRTIMSLKCFKAKRVRENLADWKKHQPKDSRISNFRKMLKEVLAEQKIHGYTDEFARTTIKADYLKTVKSRTEAATDKSK